MKTVTYWPKKKKKKKHSSVSTLRLNQHLKTKTNSYGPENTSEHQSRCISPVKINIRVRRQRESQSLHFGHYMPSVGGGNGGISCQINIVKKTLDVNVFLSRYAS